MKSIIHFVKKEFLQFKRDPKMFAIILVAPIIQLIFLGYAANLDVENVNMIVWDQDNSPASRELINDFIGSGYFTILEYVDNYKDATDYLDKAKASIILVIPTDFEKMIRRNQTAELQLLLDGSDGNSSSISAGYAQGIITGFSKNILIDLQNKMRLKNASTGNIIAEPRVWYNPDLKTRNFMVPAIVGLLISVITLILTSLAVVKEKEIGTMEQLIVTPLKPHQIIFGKLIPFVLLSFVAIILVLTAMHFVFNISVKGSTIFLFACSFLYILSTLGLGLFVSTISNTQQQAMMMAIFVVLMPMIFLSGFAFPIENMPVILQYLSYLIPLKYFITIIRGVIMKGIGFSDLWPDAMVLFLMGLLILTLSSLRFNRKLE